MNEEITQNFIILSKTILQISISAINSNVTIELIISQSNLEHLVQIVGLESDIETFYNKFQDIEYLDIDITE